MGIGIKGQSHGRVVVGGNGQPHVGVAEGRCSNMGGTRKVGCMEGTVL